MKARSIYTKFWVDGFILKLTPVEKLTFFYLISNEYVNKAGLYELPSVLMSNFLCIPVDELEKIKIKFEDNKKFYFYGDWVFIPNYYKYNKFSPVANIVLDFQKEFNSVPRAVRNYLFKEKSLEYKIPFGESKDKKIKITFNKTDVVMDIDIDIDNRLGHRVGGSVGLEDIDPDEVKI